MKVRSNEELAAAWPRITREYPSPLVQEAIPAAGEGRGVSALFNLEHEPRALFAHRRLREYPVGGGPSTLRESIECHDIVDQAKVLLQALRWYGVAMVEFKVDPRDGIPKLLEINPRFWGSLPLAAGAGVDFPYMLYRLAVDGDVEAISHYSTGIRYRWFIGDCLHFLQRDGFVRGLHRFAQSFDGSSKSDEYAADDPFPCVGWFVSTTYRSVVDRGFWADYRRKSAHTRQP
jgi:predicted ATP-grasp superfamily ATP-dependent carboligase